MKTYIVPQTTHCVVNINTMMVSVSGNGVGYGGIDNTGSKDPSVKERDMEWDEM